MLSLRRGRFGAYMTNQTNHHFCGDSFDKERGTLPGAEIIKCAIFSMPLI